MDGPAKRLARERLAREHIGFAKRIASWHAHRLYGQTGVDDLEGAAMLGLAEAVVRFEERGIPFKAYATLHIGYACVDHMRQQDSLSRSRREAAAKANVARRELGQSLGRSPTAEEVAHATGGIPVELCGENVRPTHIAVTWSGAAIYDAIRVDDGGIDGEDDIIRRHDLTIALRRLQRRHRHLIVEYFVEDRGLKEIAEQDMGITESRACQLMGKALDELRAIMDVQQ